MGNIAETQLTHALAWLKRGDWNQVHTIYSQQLLTAFGRQMTTARAHAPFQ